MMRFSEAAIFISLAAGVHIGVWTLGQGPDGASSTGGSGAQNVTLAAASPSQAEMVRRWTTAPAVSTTSAKLPSLSQNLSATAPALPRRDAPVAPQPPILTGLPAPAALDAPQIDTSPADPPPKAQAVVRPKERTAEVIRNARKSRDDRAQKQQVAQGKAKSSHRGTNGSDQIAAQDHAAANALRAQWGSAIYAQVRRNMRFPRGVSQGGTAKLALRIASNGKLQNLRLMRSSGNSDLDKAAIRAVSRAGRFSRAPKGLSGNLHDFSLSLTFAR